MTHEDWGVEFVDKNVALYHGLRNTALEKILRQKDVLHSKMLHVALPPQAHASDHYHMSLRSLDSIMLAEIPN